MKNPIREVCMNINADVLQKVRNDFRRRLDVCIQVNDGLFNIDNNCTHVQLYTVLVFRPIVFHRLDHAFILP